LHAPSDKATSTKIIARLQLARTPLDFQMKEAVLEAVLRRLALSHFDLLSSSKFSKRIEHFYFLKIIINIKYFAVKSRKLN
jgi:hypothetical protein